jgi:hypothetical protein
MQNNDSFPKSLFTAEGTDYNVSFVEHRVVKEGVTCDIYTFNNDHSKDLAIVLVKNGYKTPLQKVITGTTTTEGYVSGEAELTITTGEGQIKTYTFPSKDILSVDVNIGETMQWEAKGVVDLIFYEICTPPYEDGRFENLAD